jgi:hypothetical protein
MATIIKIPYYCFCSFVITILFVNFLCSSYLHFQKKLDNVMRECINAYITLQFFRGKVLYLQKPSAWPLMMIVFCDSYFWIKTSICVFKIFFEMLKTSWSTNTKEKIRIYMIYSYHKSVHHLSELKITNTCSCV